VRWEECWSVKHTKCYFRSPNLQDRTTPFLKTRPWARRPGSWTWAVGCNLAVTSSWLQSKSICIWINSGFLINFWVVTLLSSKSGIFVCHFGCPVPLYQLGIWSSDTFKQLCVEIPPPLDYIVFPVIIILRVWHVCITLSCWKFGTFVWPCYESQPGSWLVAICERREKRGSGGGVVAKWVKNRENRWKKMAAASMVLQGNVPAKQWRWVSIPPRSGFLGFCGLSQWTMDR